MRRQPRRPPRRSCRRRDRAAHRPAVRLLPAAVLSRDRARRLGPGRAGRRPRRRRPEPAHADGDHPRPARPDPRPQGEGAGRLRGRRRRRGHALPGQAPLGRGAQAGPASCTSRATDLERSLGDRSSGFAYLAREVDLATAEQVRKLDITGISTVPSTRRIYPGGQARHPGDRHRRDRQPGPHRARGRRQRPPGGRERRASGDRGRAGQGDRTQHGLERPARPGPEADDRRRDPGANRAGARDDSARHTSPRARRRS